MAVYAGREPVSWACQTNPMPILRVGALARPHVANWARSRGRANALADAFAAFRDPCHETAPSNTREASKFNAWNRLVRFSALQELFAASGAADVARRQNPANIFGRGHRVSGPAIKWMVVRPLNSISLPAAFHGCLQSGCHARRQAGGGKGCGIWRSIGMCLSMLGHVAATPRM